MVELLPSISCSHAVFQGNLPRNYPAIAQPQIDLDLRWFSFLIIYSLICVFLSFEIKRRAAWRKRMIKSDAVAVVTMSSNIRKREVLPTRRRAGINSTCSLS